MSEVHIRIVYTIASILFLIARLSRFETKRALRFCDIKKKDDLETGSIYSYIQDEDILDFAPHFEHIEREKGYGQLDPVCRR